MEQNLDILRQEIVDKSLEAFREGLFSGTSGNMSCRVAPDEMLITPTSVRYDMLRAQDIVRMKLDGTVLEGVLQPSSEWRMHAAVYKAYGETNAVFHTHSPYATAFAVVRKSIPAVLIESCIFLGGDIRCADYAAPGTEAVGTNAIPALRDRGLSATLSTKAVGLNAVPALKDRGGCTLANHGVLAVGKDLAQAYLRAEYIEDVAKVYTFSKVLGTPVELASL